MKLKMLHIVRDDKFVDGAASLFETDSRVENTYILIGGAKKFKYIRNTSILFVAPDKCIDYINTFDVVVLHSLLAIPLENIKEIKSDTKVVWYAWGYDIYQKPYDIIPIELLGPETKKFTRYRRFGRSISIKYIRKSLYVKKHLKEALSRIDYFSGVFPYEFDLIKKYHSEFRAEPLDFYYGSDHFFIPEQPDQVVKHGKKNIIIGNSANKTGNHLDVLKVISGIDIDKEAKIIIPLSYNAKPYYVKQVESIAEKLAPGQVVSLRSFLPLDEYLSLISNCKTAVFAHERQQATDNIFMQLLYGARVYMSETSAAYTYLKKIGLNVYSLQSDLNLFNKEMSDKDIMANRVILSSLYSSSKLIERVKNTNTMLIDKLKLGD